MGEATFSPSPPITHPHELLQQHGAKRKAMAAAAADAASDASGRRPCPALDELDDDARLAPEGHLRVGGGARDDLHHRQGEGEG